MGFHKLKLTSLVVTYFSAFLWATAALATSAPLSLSNSYWKNVETEIIVIGVGYDVASIGGHTALRIIDHNNQSDYTINWGLFDFSEPGYIQRFIAGNLIYSVGKIDTTTMVNAYINTEPERDIVSYPLNLTALQKKKLITKSHWWLAPENRYYQYHMWQKNCVTLLRDSLSHAMEDHLQNHLMTMTTDTVRGIGTKHFYIQPQIAALMNFVFNHEVDRPLTLWEQMFLPQQFISNLLQLKAIDDSGQTTTGPLLGNPKKLYPGKPLNPLYQQTAIIVSSLCIVLILLLAYFRPSAPFTIAVSISGLLGIMLVAWWFLSNLPASGFNYNLLLFWPTDLLFVCWLSSRQPRVLWLSYYYGLARVASVALILVADVSSYLPQEVSIMFITISLLTWLYFLFIRCHNEPQSHSP